MQLTRCKFGERTLYFTYPQNTGGSQRAVVGFVKPEHVPAFVGDVGWFEMERVKAKPWSYWRAKRQVEPPNDART